MGLHQGLPPDVFAEDGDEEGGGDCDWSIDDDRAWELEKFRRVCGRIRLVRNGRYSVRIVDQVSAQFAKWLDIYYEGGEEIRGARHMGRELEINRHTALAVYSRLRELGFLIRHPGQTDTVAEMAIRKGVLDQIWEEIYPLLYALAR